MKKVLTDWSGVSAGFTPVGLAGYVYLIVNTLTQRKYIGRKVFWSKNRRKVKGKKKRKLVVTESNWRYYTGSSDDLKADIEKYGRAVFRFEILEVFKTRAETNYAETKALFVNDVLYSRLPSGEFEFYNTCIGGKWYRGRA